MNSSSNIVIYDGTCNLCSSTVRFISKRDKERKFRFFSSDSTEGRLYLKNAAISADITNSIVYLKNKAGYFKSSASLTILRDLGSFWKFFYVFIFIPKPIRDFFYDLVARNRYRLFGKKESCELN